MSKYQYSETEKQINSVLKHQDEALKSIHFPSTAEAEQMLPPQKLMPCFVGLDISRIRSKA